MEKKSELRLPQESGGWEIENKGQICHSRPSLLTIGLEESRKLQR